MSTQLVHPAAARLLAFARGQVELHEIDEIQSHLCECRLCREALDDVPDDELLQLLRRASHQSDAGETVVAASGAKTDHASVDGSRPAEDGPAAASEWPTAPPQELQQHARYRVSGLIGRGGMGDVYEAEHSLMRRKVALKVIKRELTRDPHAVDRFQREVRAAASLVHGNIVAAYDAEQAGSIHFLAMEFVEGTDLASMVAARGALPVGEACEYIRQAAVGLQHAHSHGMVHRDIKPHNLMITRDGTVKILDFGLASLTEGAQDTGETTANAGILTVVGTVMGTPDYISPEQARDAGSADGRSDIYSLGATLYFLLAGRPPFSDGSVADRLLSHAQQTPRPIDVMRTDIPAGLAHVLGRMLAKNPRDRFQTAAEVAEALEAFSEAGRRNAARRRFVLGRNLALAALFLISVAFAAILYITTDQGTLIINSSSDDVDVVIRQGGREVRIVDVVTGSTVVRLPSDEYEVSLKGDQNKFTLDTNRFVLTRGSDQIVTIRMQPDGPFALPTPENAFINSIGMRLVPVPPGEFTMGAATPETEFTTREQPHTVRITKPFSIGVCEVTQQQYHQVMGHNPSAFSAAGLLNDKVQGLDTGHFPVDSVSWLDAVEFCRRLSDVPAERNAGLVYRLPLEAEWEYACRAATTTPFYYGDGLNQGLANTSGDDPTGHAEPSALQRTTLVGSYPPNALGLHDMHGNVWEWCADWYDLDYYATSPASDPPGPDAPGAEREGRVIRGGAWRYPDRYARSASRDNRDPAGGDVDLGFRVVCERAEGRDHAVAALAAIAAIQEAGGRLKFNDDNVVVNVSFNSSDVDDAGLACLSGLNQLESLYLPGTSVTDAGIEQHIKGLTGLRNLYLPGTNVTDAGMQHLAELPRLVVLYVDRTALTDAGLKHLANLELLVTLSLNGTAVTDAGLAEIEGLNHLAFLHLKDTAVTDAGLQRLTGLERLVTLDLDRTQTTDAGLEHLAKLTNLQTLGLAGTQVTDEGVAKLQQALPNCSVSR